MELFVALCAVFLGGSLAYGAAQLVRGVRDLSCQLALARAPATPLAAAARGGTLLLRGRARAGRKLLPALTRQTRGCVAFSSRSFMHRDGCATTFELVDGSAVASVEAAHPVIVGPESTDVFGDMTREIRPGDLVTIFGTVTHELDPSAPTGSYRQAARRLVVRDAPGGLMIIRPSWQPLRTVAKGTCALAASLTGLWLVIALVSGA
jgi:hypothetical protein